MTKIPFLRPLPAFGLALALAVVLAGCGLNPAGQSASVEGLNMAPLSGLPADMQKAPVVVRQAYQFAAANPDMLEQIPCYCGCGSIGHKSNYDCYVSGENPDGNLSFDTHALGCSLCVDITRDTMRLLREGKNTAEIRSYVDGTYSKYGVSNIP